MGVRVTMLFLETSEISRDSSKSPQKVNLCVWINSDFSTLTGYPRDRVNGGMISINRDELSCKTAGVVLLVKNNHNDRLKCRSL